MLACSFEIKNNIFSIISHMPCDSLGDLWICFKTYLVILLLILLKKKIKIKEMSWDDLVRLNKAVLSHPLLGTRYLKQCPCCVLSLVPPGCTVLGHRKVSLCWGLVWNGLHFLSPGLRLSSRTAQENCCHRERLRHWRPCWSRWTIDTRSGRVMPQNLTNRDFWRRKMQRRFLFLGLFIFIF